jgi:hypothetical protein
MEALYAEEDQEEDMSITTVIIFVCMWVVFARLIILIFGDKT